MIKPCKVINSDFLKERVPSVLRVTEFTLKLLSHIHGKTVDWSVKTCVTYDVNVVCNVCDII